MPENTQHTPTPWAIDETMGGKTKLWGADGTPICTVSRTRKNGLGDAALIVRAVNSHAALVAALQRAADAISSIVQQAGDAHNNDALDYALSEARAALAQARGGQS